MESGGAFELKNGYSPMHCVMDMTMLCMYYVKGVLEAASGSGGKRASMTLAQRQEEALSAMGP